MSLKFIGLSMFNISFVQYIKENGGTNLIVYIHDRNRWVLNIGRTTLGSPIKDIVDNNSIREIVWCVNDV